MYRIIVTTHSLSSVGAKCESSFKNFVMLTKIMTAINLNGLVKQRIEKLYHQHVEPLLPTERLWLVELITHDLATHNDEMPEKQKLSIMELRGLGKEI